MRARLCMRVRVSVSMRVHLYVCMGVGLLLIIVIISIINPFSRVNKLSTYISTPNVFAYPYSWGGGETLPRTPTPYLIDSLAC